MSGSSLLFLPASWGVSSCEGKLLRSNYDDGADFVSDFDSLIDSADEFKKLSGRNLVIRDSSDFYRLIPVGSHVVADILVDAYGNARIIRGRFVSANADSLVVSVNGKNRRIVTLVGVDGLSGLVVHPQGSVAAQNEYVQDYDSLLDSAEELERLSRGSSMRFGDGRNPYKNIPLGSVVMADLLKDGFGRAQIVRGRLVSVGNIYMKISVAGRIVKIPLETGIDGLTALAILSTPE